MSFGAQHQTWPLSGTRVLELASEYTGFAGLLFAALGADVTVLEPPGGSATRQFGPFADDVPGPERSLWWRYYNRGKTGVVLDLGDPGSRTEFDQLLSTFDVVVGPGTRAANNQGLSPAAICEQHPSLIWVALSPFGSDSARGREPVTDLTLQAGGGQLWSCGYDDHRLPPVRGGEGHVAHIVGFQAVIGALGALLSAIHSGRGQVVDVSLHATLNVTTELATYEWLVRGATVQRQTGRHAQVEPTQRTQVRAGDGRYVNTGVPVGDTPSSNRLLKWLEELGLQTAFDDTFLLELASSGKLDLADPAIASELLSVQRACLGFIAGQMAAHEFFIEAQERGFSAGIINAAEDLIEDQHLKARGMWVNIYEPDLDRTIIYPASPVAFDGVRRPLGPAPSLTDPQIRGSQSH
jgi:benzylsuccinate CoA-transferase BbsE subunit